jgi:type IV pilus assembly protein PilO
MTNLTKRQKEMALVVLSVILFLSLGAYSYFLVYTPAKDTNDQVKLTTSNERDVLFALQKQSASKGQTDTASSQPLQRKVPTKPLEDAVVLEIGKAEIKSGTTVQGITFTQGEFVIENPPELVENVSQLLTEVVLQSDSYIGIEKFVDEIEKMDRIFIIDSINFNVPEEIREEELEKDFIEMTVTFSAFYRPDLIDLHIEAPKTNAPPPSEKIDPTPYNDGTKVGEAE